MKKITAALALVALSTAAHANHTGFFLGAGAVTGATSAKWTSITNNNTSSQSRGDTGKTMFGGRIEAGYGMTFAGSGYAAISVYGTLTSNKTNLYTRVATNGNVVEKIDFKNRGNYGVEIKLGYHLTKDTVGFVGIAAEAGKYKLTWQESNTTFASLLSPQTASKTKVYAKPVIGLRTMFTKNLYLEAKYGYGFANRISLTVPGTTTGAVTSANGVNNTGGRTASVRPRTHEFSVTVGWRF